MSVEIANGQYVQCVAQNGRWTYKPSMRMRELVAVLLLFHATAALAQTAQLPVRGRPQYVHGINIGWFVGRYSNDIGLNPFHVEWGTGYDGPQYDKWLADCDRMNVNVVRIWLFEGHEGLLFDTDGHVRGLQPQFLTNLDDLLARIHRRGLAAELVLLNHLLADLPKNYVTDPAARAALIEHAIRPLVKRHRGNAAVFAYDLINEANLAGASWPQLRMFAHDAAAAIHAAAPGTLVTMSTQQWDFDSPAEHAEKLGGLGLDFYEFHLYADAPDLPPKPAWLDKPLLLGEYGPSTWTEAAQNAAGDALIAQARDRGYAGSAAWMYYHSPGNGENIARQPGANADWEALGLTLQRWGATLGTATTARRRVIRH